MRRRLLLALGALALAFPASASARGEFHPEEEFNLKTWIPLHVGGLDLSINKAVVYLWLGGLLACLIGWGLMRFRLKHDPDRRQTVGELIYDLVQTQIAEQGLPAKAMGTWFPYVASLFLFIWVLNMVSFVPLPISNEHFHVAGVEIPTFAIYAVTSQISVTLVLAVLSVIFTHVEGLRFNGAHYFKSFVPEGVPRLLVPFMALLETVSHAFRIVSLSVRLYANMLAGHMLILVFIGLTFIFETLFFAPVSIVFAMIFYLFEVLIVVTIQAYIFAALTAIYIGSAVEPSH